MLSSWNEYESRKFARLQVRTFHAVEDLPCNLYGSDDCRKTLVKENDILKEEHNTVRPTYVQTKAKEK